MSRRDEVKNANPNPAEIWLTWDSDKGLLTHYNKETKEDVEIKLPFQFIWLKQMHTVKGYHEATESGIFANEVDDIGQEEMTVRSFKNSKLIAKGIYAHIKQDVIDAGGKYFASIYAMTKKGTLVNISFKGSCVQAWSEFTKKTRNRLPDEWVKITGAEKHTKGKINWTTPQFAFAGSLNDNDNECADKCYKTIMDYLAGKSEAPAEQRADEKVADQVDTVAIETDDELPF